MKIRFRMLHMPVLLAALSTQGCGIADSLQTINERNDPQKLMEACFAGNDMGQCTALEGIYGVDPRVDTFCKRAASRLPDCDALRDKAKAAAGK